MLRIPCPFCGVRDHSEFAYGGDATIVYPDLEDHIEDWNAAVFMRENQRGIVQETWQHIHGCRSWIKVSRDNVTHEIISAEFCHPGFNK